MSAIPPPLLGSILQSGAAQTRATDARRQEAPAAIDRDSKSTFKADLIDLVGGNEHDASTSADAEGRGSQGRASSDASEGKSPSENESPPNSSSLDVLG